LSAEAKQQLLKSLDITTPGSVFAKLSPRNNVVGARAYVTFQNAGVVDGELEWSAFYSPLDDVNKSARISIKSEGAGHRYLYDCSVGSGMMPADKGPFKIWRNGKTIQTFDGDEDHIVFLV